MGLPGSGKSTVAAKLKVETNAVLLSSDELRLQLFAKPTFSQTEHDTLYRILDKMVDEFLAKGYDVIYDANLNRLIHRQEKYELARKHHAQCILWWVKTPAELAKQRRLSEQNHILIPSGDTPENLFDRVARVLETPTADERTIIVDGTDVENLDIHTEITRLVQS